jgi:hypothetical protein
MGLREMNLSRESFRKSTLTKILAVAFLVVNFAGLIVASLKPAGSGSIALIEDLRQIKSSDNTMVVTMPKSNPYDPWGGLVARFYLDQRLEIETLESVTDLQKMNSDSVDFLIVRHGHLEKPGFKKLILSEGFIEKSQSVPEWTVPFLKIYGGFHEENVLVLLGRD